jgi:hypothetical protein
LSGVRSLGSERSPSLTEAERGMLAGSELARRGTLAPSRRIAELQSKGRIERHARTGPWLAVREGVPYRRFALSGASRGTSALRERGRS